MNLFTSDSTSIPFEKTDQTWSSGTLPTESSPGASKLDFILANIYFYLTVTMSCLSLLGCAVIFTVYWRFRGLRTTGLRLLVYLSIADSLTALGNILGIIWYLEKESLSEDSSKMFCEAHASLTFFSSVSSFLWTVAIAIHLYVCIVKTKAHLADKCEPVFHVVCWLIPVTVAAVPCFMGVIGYDKTLETPSWCWIDPEKENTLFWQYTTGKFWEISSYFTVVILYVRVKWYLAKQLRISSRLQEPTSDNARNSSVSNLQAANRKLTYIPAVFIAIRIWGTTRFILGAHFSQFVNGIYLAWIVPLQGAGDSAQGFANCVMMIVSTSSIRSRLTRIARSFVGRSDKRNTAYGMTASGNTSMANLSGLSINVNEHI